MARKPKAQQDDDGDWKAELAKAKAARADWRSGKEEGRPDDQKPDYGVQDHAKLMTPSPDPGPEDAGEELKRKQAVPDGLTPEKDEEKARERTRLDPDTGETLLPESVEEKHRQSEAAWEGARSGGVEGVRSRRDVPEGEPDPDDPWRDNPAMLGVGRNIEAEPLNLVRAADLEGGGVDPGKRFFSGEYGPPGEGAPPAVPAGEGERHHLGAPWPAPLSPSASAPSATPEPGPEPSQQWHEPQPVEFADHEAAVRATMGPSAEQQREAQEEALAKEGEAVERRPFERADTRPTDKDPSRNSAGKLKHSFVADRMIETGMGAFGDQPPDHGTLQQALLYAQRVLRAQWRKYSAEHKGRQRPQEKPAEEPAPERSPEGA